MKRNRLPLLPLVLVFGVLGSLLLVLGIIGMIGGGLTEAWPVLAQPLVRNTALVLGALLLVAETALLIIGVRDRGRP